MNANNEFEIIESKEKTNWKYLIYVITFVLVLIVVAVAVTYAYFLITTSKEESISEVNAQMACMDFTYSETNTIELEYLWPISDEFALANLTPVTITVTNNCENSEDSINYVLALTNGVIAAEEEMFLKGDTIRIYATKKVDTNEEEELIKTDYLNSLTVLEPGNAADYVNAYLKSLMGVDDLEAVGFLATNYVIDDSTLASKSTVVYNIYLWVDYYEGDTTHTGLKDNTTEGKIFAGIISGAINP